MTTQEAINQELDAIQLRLNSIRYLATDPAPDPGKPDAPTLSIANIYVTGGPLTIELNVAATGTYRLDYRATDATGNGPTDWTPLQASGTPNVTIQPPLNDRVIEFRAITQGDGVESDPSVLSVNLNDFIPSTEG